MDDNGQLFGGNVVGVGVDLTDVERFRSMLEKYHDAFLARTFTDAEIAYCSPRANKAEAFAARFAAKEAVVKALGTGFRGAITPKSIGIENSENGAPCAVLDSAATDALRAIGGEKVLVSLTHLKDYAQAVAVAVK